MFTEAEIGKKTVMALGFFDGVHLGHAQLINMTKERAAQMGALSAVLSFDVSPMEVVTGERIPLICNTRTREDIIGRYFGIESVIIYRFNRAVMAMPWREFIDSLIARNHALHFVIGHDFNCGFRGEGTAARIADYCAEIGVGCDIIPEFKLEGITVSSTYIRSLIVSGDIEMANRFLGHPYCISGEVEAGRGVGRKLGTPTINIRMDSGMALLPFGVYATMVRFDGTERKAVTNVGVRPTFGSGDEITVESFILDFSGNLYDRKVSVDFFKFLRPEKRFSDEAALAAQIQKDALEAERVLEQI